MSEIKATNVEINFTKLTNLIDLKKFTPILLLSSEEVKKSKFIPIKIAKESDKFEGKEGQISVAALNSENTIMLVGLGEEKMINDLMLQKLGGKIISFCNSYKKENLMLLMDGRIENNKIKYGSLNTTHNLSQIAFGASLLSYRFNKYFNNKKAEKELKIKKISFATNEDKEAKAEFTKLQITINNIFLARDLVSEPANTLYPQSYADICMEFKKDGLDIEVLGEKEMKKLGMGSLLGVGQGSDKESKLVIIKWFGAKDKKEQPLAFVGKGVTFDTGGISIKPSQNMEDMKTDMAGSAVVVSLLRLLAQRKAKVNVIGVVGLTENMPSGSAQRPGDIVTSMSGQTIEVINTDAEGRLVLADALHYTNVKFKPKFIIDLATLTGAITVALADIYSGLFSNDDDLSNQIIKAGEKTGELTWRFPLSKEYDEMINSDIADMKNVGAGRGAGSITAAQFLKRFIGETKWAHLDIAGVAWKGKGDALAVKGATGYGVRLLNQLIIDNHEK
jgi:leucyl aminopeptidase